MLTYHPLTIADVASGSAATARVHHARSAATSCASVSLRCRAAHRRARARSTARRCGARTRSAAAPTIVTCASACALHEQRQHVAVTSAAALRVGDTLEVLTPTGRFFVATDAAGCAHVLRVRRRQRHHADSWHREERAARSEPRQPLHAVLRQSHDATIMFAEELLALKDRYPAAPGAVFPDEPRAAGHRVVQRPARCARRSTLLASDAVRSARRRCVLPLRPGHDDRMRCAKRSVGSGRRRRRASTRERFRERMRRRAVKSRLKPRPAAERQPRQRRRRRR